MGYSVLGSQWSFNNYITMNPVLENPIIQRIAFGQQRTEANVILRWAMYQNVIALTSSKQKHNTMTNFQSLEVLLNSDDIEDIEITPEIDLDKLNAAMDEYEENTPESERKPFVNDIFDFFKTYKVAVGDDSTDDNTDEEGLCGEGGGECSLRGDHEKSKYSAENNFDDEGEVPEWVKPEHPGSKATVFERVDLNEETIYFGAEDSHMYALDAKTGKIKWKFQTSYSDLGSSPAFSLDQRVIYFGGEDGYFYALSAQDGSVQWTFETDKSIISSPAIGKDGSIYFGGLDGFMYALQPDGKVKWKRDLGIEMWASPMLLSYQDDELVYIPQMSSEVPKPNVHALNGKDGSVVYKFTDGVDGFFASPRPSMDNTTVYFCSLNGYVYARNAYNGQLIKKKRVAPGEEISTTPAVGNKGMILGTSSGFLVGLERESLKEVWKTHLGGNLMSSPLVGPNKSVYIGTGDGRIVAVNYTDGSILWKVETEDSDIWSSPSLDKDGRLFIGAFDGHMYALNSTSGEILWKTDIGTPIVSRALITTKYRELTLSERYALKSTE